jgi:hypothetical protein
MAFVTPLEADAGALPLHRSPSNRQEVFVGGTQPMLHVLDEHHAPPWCGP